jgi:dihydroneopterin triphosphate diphosphatase
MPRAPFQVLVLPYRRRTDGEYEFAIFRRADAAVWQGLAGGGEEGETPDQAARREGLEEGGIPPDAPYRALDARASIPVTHFRDSHRWGEAMYVIPEYAFGVDVGDRPLRLSAEHTAVRWVSGAEAQRLVRFDSNRVALWELHQKLRGLGPRGAPR